MEKFTVHTGLVAPLDRENVDTDAIIPKQFLKSIERTGFGQHLFDAWRFLDTGEPADVVGGGVRGIEPDHLIGVRDGAIDVALVAPGAGAVEEGALVFRIEPDRLIVIRNGAVELALAPISIASIVEGVGVSGIDRDGFVVVL